MPNGAVPNSILTSPSMRWRLSFWTTMVSLAIQVVLGGALYVQLYRTTDEVLTGGLAGRGQMVAAGLSGLSGTDEVTDERLSRIATGPMLSGGSGDFAVAVYRADGSLLAATSRPMPEFGGLTRGVAGAVVERRGVRGLNAGAGGEETGRVLIRPLVGSPASAHTLVIVADDGQFERVISVTKRTLLLSMLVGTVATGSAAWLISGLSLRPLRKLPAIASSFEPESIRGESRMVPMPSELEEFRRELSSARERLSESFRAQDRLISNVSHELKTPIAVLLTEAETIDLDAMPADGVRFVRSVREEMRRLGGMIESFVALSRLRGGKALAPVRVCSLNDVLVEAVAGCKAAAQRRGVMIRADAVEGADPPMVHGDAELLTTMFAHVIRNCIRFSVSGDEIDVTAGVRDGRCFVEVADVGSPVPEALLLRLFDRFVDEADHCENRRELGLQVAQGVAELHGGRISACNRAPKGCKFTVELPLVAEVSVA